MGPVRILFTATPLVGHVLPMLPLMHAAHEAGHEVVMATGAEMAPVVARRGFATWTVGPDIVEVLAELERTRAAPAASRAGAPRPGSQEEQLGRDAVHLFARPSARRARDLIPRATAWRPGVVV